MRTILLLIPVLLIAGCSKQPPTLAGGKPVRHWVEALQDPDPATRRTAVTKLGNVGSADPAALPALVQALHDADARVRYEAILALVKLGPQAATARTDLSELAQRDPSPEVRSCAARALERIPDGSPPSGLRRSS